MFRPPNTNYPIQAHIQIMYVRVEYEIQAIPNMQTTISHILVTT